MDDFSHTIYPYFFYDGEDWPPNPDNWFAGLYLGGYFQIFTEVPMTPDDFFNNSHQVIFTITHTSNNSYLGTLSAYGVNDTDTATIGSGQRFWDDIFIGSQHSNNLESICICGIKTLTNNPNNPEEENFTFPDKPFDVTVGTGQSISGDAVIVTGPASGSGEVGYRKRFYIPWDPASYDLACRVPCPDNNIVNATFSGRVPCNCVADGTNYGWLLDASIVNQSFPLRRTILQPPDSMQWESGHPMGIVNALRHYTKVPDAIKNPCLAVYSACVAGCAGNGACLQACHDAMPVCVDCDYWGDRTDLRSCTCYDIDPACICGAHIVLQCVVPSPEFPSTRGNIGMSVVKGFDCGTPDNINCKLDCAATYDDCQAGCNGDGSCESTCFSAANVCEDNCEDLYPSSCATGSSPIAIFSWVANSTEELFDTVHNNTASGTCGTNRFGGSGTVFLELGEDLNPAP